MRPMDLPEMEAGPSGPSAVDPHVSLYPAGAQLFVEGDPGTEMYVIQSGRVELTRKLGGLDKVLAELPAGEFFGEMAILNRKPRSASARVVADAKLLVIDGETFELMLRNNTEIAVRLIHKLAARLERANQQIESLLMRDTNHRVVTTLRAVAKLQGVPVEDGVRVLMTEQDLATRLMIESEEITVALEKLSKVGLVTPVAGGFLVAEDGQLQDFLEFQEIRERYGR